jgi:hypothetical protein
MTSPIFPKLYSDTWVHILKDQNAKEIALCAQVCKIWNASLEEDSFWQKMFSLHFPHESRHGTENFKLAYKTQYVYEQNLKYGMHTLLQFQRPEPSVIWGKSLLQFQPPEPSVILGKWLAATHTKIFASCSPETTITPPDTTLKVWDINAMCEFS